MPIKPLLLRISPPPDLSTPNNLQGTLAKLRKQEGNEVAPSSNRQSHSSVGG